MAAGIRITISGDREVMARLSRLQGLGLSRAMRQAMQRSLDAIYRRVQTNLAGVVLKVKTGRLRQSISTEVSPDGKRGVIGTNVEYAAMHEFGGRTVPHPIVPRFAKALHFQPHWSPVPVFRKSVRHPGSVMPARPYFRPALSESLPDIRAIFTKELGDALDGEA